MADSRSGADAPRLERGSSSQNARRSRRLPIASILVLILALTPASVSAATFVVNNTINLADLNPGDGNCFTGNTLPPFFAQECTLRAAIEEANALAGYDTIEFASSLPVDGAGAVIFAPGSGGLPAITDGVLIDGYTANTYATGDPWAVPVIHIDGTFAGGLANGLTLLSGAGGSVIRGLAVNDFALDGIKIGQFSPPEGVIAVTIQGCHVGLYRGTVANGNGDEGIAMPTGTDSTNVVIGQTCNGTSGCIGRGNVISANGSNGITINATAADVGGNRIGTDGAGSSATGFGNGGFGIRLAYGSFSSIGLFVIVDPLGAATPDTAGNVISANTLGGVSIEDGPTTVYANRIGTDASGTAALANGGPGLWIAGGDNAVGGEGFAADAGNVISANVGEGIRIDGTSSGNDIVGNRIGVSDDASTALGNQLDGIYVANGRDDNIITANVIASNLGDGIDLGSDHNSVRRNWIGTNSLDASLGNTGAGLRLHGAYTEVGGLLEGNVIGFNLFGILIESTSIWSQIQGNAIGSSDGTDIGNSADGILAYGATHTIGGDAANPNTSGNVIGHNGDDGIEFSGVQGGNNWVYGNWIGIEPSGTQAGNDGHGVRVGNTNFIVVGSQWSSPGTLVTSKGNDIAHNVGDAVRITGTGSANAVRGNRMRQNGGRGIELEPVGPTPNDPDDSDGGPNGQQNHPIVDAGGSGYVAGSNRLYVRLQLDGNPIYVDPPLAIDVYLADASGQEGLEWVGADEITTPELGAYQVFVISPPSGGFPAIGTIVTTATTSNNTGTTSEFSPPVQVPEPARHSLLVAGLGALAVLRRLSLERRARVAAS